MDAVRAPVPNDEAFALQLVERTRDRFARGAGHLAEKVVRQREVEPDPVPTDAAVIPGELDQLLAHPVDVVKPGHRCKGRLLLAEGVRESREQKARHLAPRLKGIIKQDFILRHWDDFLRLAGSLKLGWVTASLFISKLQAYPRQNILARALQEYGRLVKTLFILRYLESQDYRRRINAHFF